MNNTKKKFRFPFVILLIAGIIAVVICINGIIPAWAAQTMCDLMPAAAEQVEGVCTVVDYHDDNTVTVTAQYNYGYYTYENVFADVTLGSDRTPLSVGDKITLYIFDDNVFFYDAINNNITLTIGSIDEAYELAEQFNYIYKETSCLENYNLNEIFEDIIQNVKYYIENSQHYAHRDTITLNRNNHRDDNSNIENNSSLNNNRRHKRNGCC